MHADKHVRQHKNAQVHSKCHNESKFKKKVKKNSHVLSSTKNCTGVVGNGYAYELVRPGGAAAAGVDCDGAVWRGAKTLK